MTLEQIIIWLLIGGVIGWLAGLLVKGSGQGVILNIVVGIVGSYLGAYLFGTMFNIGKAGPYVSAFLGAVILLLIVTLIQRAGSRRR